MKGVRESIFSLYMLLSLFTVTTFIITIIYTIKYISEVNAYAMNFSCNVTSNMNLDAMDKNIADYKTNMQIYAVITFVLAVLF